MLWFTVLHSRALVVQGGLGRVKELVSAELHMSTGSIKHQDLGSGCGGLSLFRGCRAGFGFWAAAALRGVEGRGGMGATLSTQQQKETQKKH